MMAEFTKENSKMMSKMDKRSVYIATEDFFRDCTRMEKEMVLVILNRKMGIFLRIIPKWRAKWLWHS